MLKLQFNLYFQRIFTAFDTEYVCMKVNKTLLKWFLFIVLCCCLHTGDCHGTDNVFVTAASGQVVNWLGQTLSDRTISFCFSEPLGNLICYVSGLKVGE